MEAPDYRSRILLLLAFGMAMAYLEAAVVVYLRELYYPGGFTFPMRAMPGHITIIEIARETATIVMLVAVAGLAARRFWDRFGCFLIMFGVWDIFYYVWLRVTIDWPSTLTSWDVLFLIPVPWTGPVIAPILVSAVMILAGLGITHQYARGIAFRPTGLAWLLTVVATIVILYTFMNDSAAATAGGMPESYMYHLLAAGLAFYLAAFVHAYGRSAKNTGTSVQGRRK